MFGKSSRIAVLDPTHGGLVIARKLSKLAKSVAIVDVYGTLGTEVLSGLESEGIKTYRDAQDVVDFDMIIAPVHLDPSYTMLVDASKNQIPVISHHAAVGGILSNYNLGGKTLIEITGTKAKTSTSILLSEILSGEKKVVSHTSRGIEDWNTGRLIRKGLSITPASMLSALDDIFGAGVDFDVFISEISLGGTGSADIGVITTIANDYKIANSRRSASEAKRQMILNARPGSKLVVNNNALRFFGGCRRDIEIISFSEDIDASCNVYYEVMGSGGGTIAYYYKGKKGRIGIRGNKDFDILSYKTAFVCACAIAITLNMGGDVIERAFEGFKGAEGRMKKTAYEGRILIDNSNSGMDIRNAETALEFSKANGEKIVMVLGEEAKEVCEGLDPAGVKRFIDKHGNEIEALILVGERMQPLLQSGRNIYYADNLKKGLECAVELSHENEIILSCVKCFR